MANPRVPTRGTAPDYLLEAQLGDGAMGIVYLGKMRTPAGERSVAIKQLTSSDSTHSELLIAEACLAFRLQHANICQVLDLGVGDQGWFIVMEYVRGLDLRNLLRHLEAEPNMLDVASAVFIGVEVAQALDYAHRRTDEKGAPLLLVHSDVAPQNILLSDEGEVKLADFGIARALQTLAPGNAVRGGTPGFMAPEVLEGTTDQRADLYSLGATLVAALTGSPAVDELKSRRSDLPPDLIEILRRATAPRPQDRFATAADLKQALAFFLARRFPGYTSTELSRLVRKYMGEKQPRAAVRALTLRSLREAEEQKGAASEKEDQPQQEELPSGGTERFAPPSTASRRLVPVIVLGTLVVGGGIAAWIMLHNNSGSDSSAKSAPLARAPSSGLQSSAATKPPADVVAASKPSSPAAAVKTRPGGAVAKRNGYLTVNSTPWGAVLIDGQKRADFTPTYKLAVSPGKHRVQILGGDGKTRSAAQEVVIESDQTKILGFHF